MESEICNAERSDTVTVNAFGHLVMQLGGGNSTE